MSRGDCDRKQTMPVALWAEERAGLTAAAQPTSRVITMITPSECPVPSPPPPARLESRGAAVS